MAIAFLLLAGSLATVLTAAACNPPRETETDTRGRSENTSPAKASPDIRAGALAEFMGASGGVYEVEVRSHPAMEATIRCEVSLWSRNLGTFKVSTKVVDLDPSERKLVSLNYTVGMPLDTLFTEEDCRYR